jgi:hypothetical protein
VLTTRNWLIDHVDLYMPLMACVNNMDASKAYSIKVCVIRACVTKAYAIEACVTKAYAIRACVNRAYPTMACVTRACAIKANIINVYW